MRVLVLVGSNRPGSVNQALADIAVAALPTSVTVERYDALADLPFYAEDLDTPDRLPATALAFRAAVEAADAVIAVTPEYNGSVPALLKNALDWASRPRGAASIAGMPVIVLGASMSPRAAQWARESLVRSFKVAGAQPVEDTVGIGSAYETLRDGAITDPALAEAVTELVGRLPGLVSDAA